VIFVGIRIAMHALVDLTNGGIPPKQCELDEASTL
jgi:hypothetical protein